MIFTKTLRKERIPLILQQDAMDCGPACLAMIAGYYGRQLDRNHLRYHCSLGKSGVSLLGISKAAEEIGFKTVGGRIAFETLASKQPFPCIIPAKPLYNAQIGGSFFIIHTISVPLKSGQVNINQTIPEKGKN